MKRTPGMILAVILVAVVGAAMASVSKQIDATATVDSSSNFTVALYPSLTNTTFNWNLNVFPNMAFGTLVNSVAGDKTSALTSNTAYVAYVSVNSNAGTAYRVQYSGSPLTHTDGVTTLSNDVFTVAAGPHYLNSTAIATVCQGCVLTTKQSAGTATYDVYNTNRGNTNAVSDSFDMYFGLTGDPRNAVGNKTLIGSTQKSGTYSSHVYLTLYP